MAKTFNNFDKCAQDAMLLKNISHQKPKAPKGLLMPHSPLSSCKRTVNKGFVMQKERQQREAL
jgi:hypothetical protein